MNSTMVRWFCYGLAMLCLSLAACGGRGENRSDKVKGAIQVKIVDSRFENRLKLGEDVPRTPLGAREFLGIEGLTWSREIENRTSRNVALWLTVLEVPSFEIELDWFHWDFIKKIWPAHAVREPVSYFTDLSEIEVISSKSDVPLEIEEIRPNSEFRVVLPASSKIVLSLRLRARGLLECEMQASRWVDVYRCRGNYNEYHYFNQGHCCRNSGEHFRVDSETLTPSGAILFGKWSAELKLTEENQEVDSSSVFLEHIQEEISPVTMGSDLSYSRKRLNSCAPFWNSLGC